MLLRKGREYSWDLITSQNLKYRLFTSPAVITGNEELVDFTFEDDATAGEVKTLLPGSWSRSEDSGTTIGAYPEQTFTYTAPADNEVKGSVILTNDETTVLSATIGPGGPGNLPATPGPGDRVKATPRLDITA